MMMMMRRRRMQITSWSLFQELTEVVIQWWSLLWQSWSIRFHSTQTRTVSLSANSHFNSGMCFWLQSKWNPWLFMPQLTTWYNSTTLMVSGSTIWAPMRGTRSKPSFLQQKQQDVMLKLFFWQQISTFSRFNFFADNAIQGAEGKIRPLPLRG